MLFDISLAAVLRWSCIIISVAINALGIAAPAIAVCLECTCCCCGGGGGGIVVGVLHLVSFCLSSKMFLVRVTCNRSQSMVGCSLLNCSHSCLDSGVHAVLQGLSQVIFVVATGKQLLFRQYAIAFKKSGAQVPRTELAEIGPRIDFSIRRSRAAPDEIQTQSMKQPKVEKKKVGSPSLLVHTDMS